MKTPNIKICIPKPCNENWASMTPDEQGRFCSVCAKSVVDFTTMNIQEAQTYLQEHKNEKVCGRFTAEMLEPTFVFKIQETVLYQQRSFKKVFLLALFVVMGTSLFSCRNSTGQTMGEVVVAYDSTLVVKDTVEDEILMGEYMPLDEKDSVPLPLKPNIKVSEIK